MKNKLQIPDFKNEGEEQKFWQDLDLSQYFESSDFQSTSFPNLKPTSQSVAIRIPSYLLVRIKEKANALSIPYQSLMKTYLKKGLLR